MAPRGSNDNDQPQADQAGTDLAIRDRALLAKFAEMAGMIPADTGDGVESIVSQILEATRWEDLSAPFTTSDVGDIIGKTLKLEHVTRRPSSIGGGLGMFLVCHLYDPRTDKRYVKATGSVAIIAIITRAYALNAMPIMVVWRKAERPTEQGYYPQHLDVVDSMGPGVS